MLDLSLSLIPFLVVTVGNFFLSWLWYSPALFAGPWMKALGISPDRTMTEKEKKAMPWLFLSGLLASALFAYGLGVLVHSLKAVNFLDGALIGGALWLFFVVTHSLNTLWEGRKRRVLLINNGLFFLTYVGFGGFTALVR